jgi:hypothetical protein
MKQKTQKYEIGSVMVYSVVAIWIVLVSFVIASDILNQNTRLTSLEDADDSWYDLVVTPPSQDETILKILDAEWVCTTNKTVQKTVDVKENRRRCMDMMNIKELTKQENGLYTITFYNTRDYFTNVIRDGVFSGLFGCIEKGSTVVEETECDEWMLVKK